MRKNLQHITLKKQTENQGFGLDKNEPSTVPEGILFKSTYTKKDIEDLEHLHFTAGIPPYLRGPYSTMYVTKPWIIKQNSGFSTAKDSNAFYKRNLKAGQQSLSVAFDLATHRGYDSDHEKVIGQVGKTGVAIDSVEDMKLLFDQIPLEDISVSLNINTAVLPIMAFYIVAAEEQGVKPEQLSGSIQNDILQEFMLNKTAIYPLKSSMRIVLDILEYASKYLPKFNGISISGNLTKKADDTCATELAYTLAKGLEYIKQGLDAGLEIDKIAPRLSFSWSIGMNHFTEIAKMRAARMLWSKLVQQFNPKNPKSLLLRVHCQTSGRSLTAKDPFNNVARTTIEAAAAVFGGTQSLHTNALDHAVALPTDFSERIARNTQLYLQEETHITKTVDPWAGSYGIEKLTAEIAEKAWTLIKDIEAAGLPKIKIAEPSACEKTKQDIIVGMNKYVLEKETPIPTLKVDTEAVRKYQTEQLQKIKAHRNSEKVKTTLQRLSEAAQTGKNNLLTLAIEAAQERATLGEITKALAFEKI